MAPGDRSASKGTPAIARNTMRRRSGLGKQQPKKGPATLQGLRQNNRELAHRLEATELSLQRSHARCVDLQAEKISLNEQLVLCSKDLADLRKQLAAERCHFSKLAECIVSVKGVVDQTMCDFVQPYLPTVSKGECSPHSASLTSPVLQDKTNVPPAQRSGKAYNIRAAREEFNVPTLSHTPIAHKPTTANIEEEQFVTPFNATVSFVDTNTLSSGSRSESLYTFGSPAISGSTENVTDAMEDLAEHDGIRGCEVAPGADMVASPVAGAVDGPESIGHPCSSSDAASAGSVSSSAESLSPSACPQTSPGSTLSLRAGEQASDGAKLKRRRSVSSYKEPSIGSKLRSGDPFTESNPHWESSAQSAKKAAKRRRSCNNFPSIVHYQDSS